MARRAKTTGRSGKERGAKSYAHPEAGALLRPDIGTQAQFRKKKPPATYRYDSSLSPALDWDQQNPAREQAEAKLAALADRIARLSAIVDAGDGDDFSLSTLAEIREELAAAKAEAAGLKALSRPFLDWAGKAERPSFDVPTLHVAANSLQYRRFASDFPYKERGNLWTDTLTGSFTDEKTYVVQTNPRVVERSLLMTSEPGDLVMGDLLRNLRSSQIFSVCGLPDVRIRQTEDHEYQVELFGLDVFDPISMDSDHREGNDVPARFLDTDYTGMCFHVCQAFFPRTAAWEGIKRSLRGEFEDSAWAHLAGTVSAPFQAGERGQIAVKMIDDRGNELIVVKPFAQSREMIHSGTTRSLPLQLGRLRTIPGEDPAGRNGAQYPSSAVDSHSGATA